MTKKISLPLIFCLLFTTRLSHPLIYQISCWEKDGNTVNIFYDWHQDTPDFQDTFKQHEALVERNSFKIVEDWTGYQTDHLTTLQKISCFIRTSPLSSCLIKTDANVSIDPAAYTSTDYQAGTLATPMMFLANLPHSYNAECRYDPALHIFQFTSWENAKQVTQKTIGEIACYNDGPILNDIYKDIVEECNTILNSNRLLVYLPIDFSQMPNQTTCYNTLIQSLQTWNSRLVDAQALHALYNHAHQKVIDIILGGFHAQAIEKIVPELGYTKVKTIGEPVFLIDHHTAIIPVIDIAQELDNTADLPPISDSDKKRVIQEHRRYYNRSLLMQCWQKNLQLCNYLNKTIEQASLATCIVAGCCIGTLWSILLS